MKGQAEVTEVITIVGMIVVLIVVLPVILPIIQRTILKFTLDSPEVVSKDLASLISSTVASTGDMSVKYEVVSGSLYNVKLNGKMVAVSREVGGKLRESSDPILIDAKGSFPNTKNFLVEKKVGETYVEYFINGKSIYLEGVKPTTPIPPEDVDEPGGDSDDSWFSLDFCPVSYITLSSIDCGSGKVDLLDYYIPDYPVTNKIVHLDGSGTVEYFHTYLASGDGNSGTFYVTKSQDPKYFEEFRYDENYVYHMKDTTWATGPGEDVKCENGDDAYFTLVDGFYGEDNCGVLDNQVEGGKLHPRCMNIGEETPGYELTVIGFSEETCKCCRTDYTGNFVESVTFISKGEVDFPTGWSGDDVVKLYKSSTRETYYYDKELGWIGFEDLDENGNVIHTAYIKETIPEVYCAELECKIV